MSYQSNFAQPEQQHTLLHWHCIMGPSLMPTLSSLSVPLAPSRKNDGNHKRTQFESQTYSGIALGRDRNSNAVIFWCPDSSRFVTSADYTLDENKDLKDAFPGIAHDGGLEI